jgi:dipeptidyl aminopeptidase/acylaminoacyl peptidase
MKKIMRYIFFALVFIMFLSLWAFYLGIRPLRITSQITPKTFGVNYESVQFKTADHLLIKGWYIPNKNPQAKTIVLLHGYPADKADILPSRLFLHKNYNLLFFDFRYFGESEGYYSTIGKKEVLDLQAAIQYLKNRGISSVGVWGFSLGGAVALLTAAKTPEIKAMVAEAPFARLDWMADDYYPIPGLNYLISQFLKFWSWIFLNMDVNSVNPFQEIEQLKIPILLIYSKSDQVIKFKHALLMQKTTKMNPYIKFIIVNGKRHGEPIENYQEVINHFFEQNLK